jgi:hypothetical protein
VKSWLQQHNSCPNCRASVDKNAPVAVESEEKEDDLPIMRIEIIPVLDISARRARVNGDRMPLLFRPQDDPMFRIAQALLDHMMNQR